MRTVIQLPDEQVEALARCCRRKGVSRAEAIRRAIRAFLADRVTSDGDEAFGIWSDLGEDARDYEDALRAEWET